MFTNIAIKNNKYFEETLTYQRPSANFSLVISYAILMLKKEKYY